jgi:hypothetical protein
MAETIAPSSRPAPPVAMEPSKPLASALVEAFFKRRATKDQMTHQVMAQERATLRRFIEHAGNRPIDDYDRGDITGYLDIPRQLPSDYGRSPKDKDISLADLIVRAKRKKSKRSATPPSRV